MQSLQIVRQVFPPVRAMLDPTLLQEPIQIIPGFKPQQTL